MRIRLPELPDDLQDYGYFLELVRTLEQSLDDLSDTTSTLINVQSLSMEPEVITSNADLGLNSVILIDSSSGAVDITLPPPTSNYRSIFFVKKISSDGNSVSVSARDSGNVEGVASYSLTGTLPGVQLVSDGKDYWVLAKTG